MYARRYNRRFGNQIPEHHMADRTRTRRNTLERRCLPKMLKRLFVGRSRPVFRMLEKVKRV